MIFIIYFILLGVALFAIGISGMIATKNFMIMLVSIEIALTASALVVLAEFSYSGTENIILALLMIWAIAATEAIALITFYKYAAKREIGADISRFTKLKDTK
ncbi:MAG: NADH-quinone oxidoreductase subunit K [Candidatus Micrarchaeia archaeon]